MRFHMFLLMNENIRICFVCIWTCFMNVYQKLKMDSSKSDFFIFNELSALNKQMARFKYSCCALYGDKLAFGAGAGSVHIYSYKDLSSPLVLSIPSIVTSVQLLSFSPMGKFLAVGGSSSLHFIEDPLTNPVISYSVDLKSKKPVAIHWIMEPPAKLNRTPFLLLGDETGGIWSVRHQTAELLATVNSQVVQLQQINEESILIAAINGSYFLKNGTISNIRGKRPPGSFGAIFSKDFNAILFSRPDGILYISTPEGKPQTKINILENQQIDPNENVSKDLRYLVQVSNFLVSAGKDSYAYFINLKNVSLQEMIRPESEFIDLSAYRNNCLLLWKNRCVMFRVCTHDTEYYRYLMDKKEYNKLQQLAIERKLKDKWLLEEMNVNPSPEFEEYLNKIQLESQPQPLKKVDEELYNEFLSKDIPTDEMIDKLDKMMSTLNIEDEIVEKINKYVIQNPQNYEKWESYLNIDELIPLINDDPKNSAVVRKLSPKGTSVLCKMIANIPNVELDVLVANSPPIQIHNIDEKRRADFVKLLHKNDIFTQDEPEPAQKENEEELIDSPFEIERGKINEGNCTPDAILSLLRLNDWETQLSDAINELCTQTETYMLSRDRGSIPPWVEELAKKESLGITLSVPVEKDSGGNWGVIPDLHICPICGLPLQLQDNPTSASAFPCGHAYHVGCLKTRYCPLCYADCLN